MTQEHRPGKGCFFYGCLTFIFLLLAVAVGTYFGTRKAVRMAVDSYLDSRPVQLPTVTLPEAEKRAVTERFEKAFADAQAGKPTPPIELTDDQLNVALRESGVLGRVKDQVFLRIETNQLKADISIPLDQFQLWRDLGKKLWLGNMLQGKYLNGTANLAVSVATNTLHVNVTDIRVKGEALPDTFIANLKTQNLATPPAQGESTRKLLEQVENVEVRDDKVVIRLKQPFKEEQI